MKKIIAAIILILSTLLVITASNIADVKSEPEISMKFKVSNMTNEEFQYVGTKGLNNPTKDDFENIEFNLEVDNSNEISNRKSTIPDLKAVANSYDKERYWFGESGTDDSQVNKSAKYNYKFTFYSKGLTEQDIKKNFNSSEVKISWTTSNDENKEKTIKLGDVIEF